MRIRKSGVFLTVRVVSDKEIILKDRIYGNHSITEPVLIKLLQCEPLTRLKFVSQHGITAFLRCSAPVTRYEHSVGAFLLVRKVGGSLEDQIAALLHDVSHTVFSHVTDSVLSKPGESFHEVYKPHYMLETHLPELMTEHRITREVFKEELYSLVERPAPHLCADRLDYALRDGIVTRNLRLHEAQQIYQILTAVPDATSGDRVLAIPDPQLALKLARGYIATDEALWCNALYLEWYRQMGQVIWEALELCRKSQGRDGIWKQALWTMSEENFWRHLPYPRISLEIEDQAERLKRARRLGKDEPKKLPLPKDAKVRTIDPEVLVEGKIQPLSEVLPEWGVERGEYLARREAERESAPKSESSDLML